jgi:hypothetical protein
MKSNLIRCLFLFGALLLLNLSTAQADNCSAVDLAKEMGPVRNQGDIGWCYANAAADLLSYRYRSELKGQQVSALYTALMFNSKFYEQTLISKATQKITDKIISEGGSISLAVKAAITEGFCPRTKDDNFIKQGTGYSLQKKLQLGLRLKALYDQRQMQKLRETINKIRSTNSILNEVPDSRLYKVLETSTQETFLKGLADELCQGKKFRPKTESDVDLVLMPRVSGLSWALFKKMNSELDEKRPVGVGYYSTLFKSYALPIETTDAHASVVIGRKKINGQCHYKLRNSWGSGCNYKNPAFQGAGCEGGNLWVSENEFKRYLYAVISLKEK